MKKSASRVGVVAACCFVFLAVSALADDSGANMDQERAQGMADINKAITEARAIPHFENGKSAGYHKTPSNTGGVYENLELKNSDVMTARDLNYAPSNETIQAPQSESLMEF